MAFSPDGVRFMASFSDPQESQLNLGSWFLNMVHPLNRRARCFTLNKKPAHVTAMAFHPNGKRLALALLKEGPENQCSSALSAWDIPEFTSSSQTKYTRDFAFTSLVFIQERNRLIAGATEPHTESGAIVLWDLSTGAYKQVFRDLQPQSLVTSVASYRGRSCFAAGFRNSKVKVWNTDSLKLIRALSCHRDTVVSVRFDPREGQLVSADAQGKVKF
ncbi:MAG: hypothetical protein AAF355_11605 [Myxococcota bacterium]